MSNRITAPLIAPPITEDQIKDSKPKFKSKSSNMERFINMNDVATMSIYEYRIIILFMIHKGKKVKDEDAEENQLFEISQTKNKDLFPNPNSFYDAIKNLTKLDIISKVEGKRSLYRMNPRFISNMTYQQEVNTGYKQIFHGKIKK